MFYLYKQIIQIKFGKICLIRRICILTLRKLFKLEQLNLFNNNHVLDHHRQKVYLKMLKAHQNKNI
jgi:hypothetical protein